MIDPLPVAMSLPMRRVGRTTRAGAPVPGFAGPGHVAVEVFGPEMLSLTDPFVMLMDDSLDFPPGQPVGAAHPHAGLETVTLVLEGSLDDADEGLLQAGDLAWMTAGRGVIHNEQVTATGHARILQLWIALSKGERRAPPDIQLVPLASAPVRREPGVEARLYSGRTGLAFSPTRNRAPTTVVDFHLRPGALVEQVLPGADTTFLYVIDGAVMVAGEILSTGDVGWLARVPRDSSRLRIDAGTSGARVLLVSAQPLGESIVHHGPFVAGSRHELAEYYRSFNEGDFDTISRIVRRSDIRPEPAVWMP